MNHGKPEVILDVDGVQADFVKKYLETIAQVTGKQFRPEDIDQWDIAVALGLSAAEIAEVDRLVMTPEWCRSLEMCEGAQEYVPQLRAVADVHVVTSPFRGRFWPGERSEWLIDLLGFDHHDITHSHRKHRIDADFIVDDKAKTCVLWKQHHPHGTAVLWHTYFNRNDHDSGFVRVEGWQQLIALVSAWQPPR